VQARKEDIYNYVKSRIKYLVTNSNTYLLHCNKKAELVIFSAEYFLGSQYTRAKVLLNKNLVVIKGAFDYPCLLIHYNYSAHAHIQIPPRSC